MHLRMHIYDPGSRFADAPRMASPTIPNPCDCVLFSFPNLKHASLKP